MADYSEQQLIGALRKADAAGDTAAAKAIARRIQSMRQGAQTAPQQPSAPPMPIQDMAPVQAERPDFSGVSGRMDSTADAPAPPLTEEQWQAERDKLAAEDPLEGQGAYSKYLAGLFKSGSDTVRGIGQAAVDSASMSAMNATIGLNALGLEGARDFVGRNVAEPLRQKSVQLQQATAQRRVDEAPITDSAAGMAGNVIGTLGQLVGPGIAARGTAAAGMLLPRTIGGNALQGGLVGALQPVAFEGERGSNALLGLGAGAAGAAVPKALGAAARGAANLAPAVTQNSQNRAAAKVLNAFADNPNALLQGARNAQTIVPGSLPTLAEATGDVGLAGLQRTLANTPEFANPLTLRREANNAARVRAIEGEFGGANAAAADSLKSARDLAARQTLRPIGSISIQDLAPLQNGVARLLVKNQAAPAVRGALSELQGEIANIKTVQDAHYFRQYLGQLMTGMVDGKAGAKLARKELMTVQMLLDRQMGQAFPDWGKFLREYKGASRQIGQVNVGEALLDKGPNMRAIGEVPQLSPAKFAGAADDLDRVAASATEFRRARADTLLTSQQRQVVDDVRRDLERYAQTESRGKAIGSNTMQNAIGGNRLQDAAGPVGAAIIEPVSGVAILALNQMRKAYGAKVARIVEEAMLDPARAAEILATVPAGQRTEVVRAAARLIPGISGTAGGSTPAFTE
jgi:hypothetical protein